MDVLDRGVQRVHCLIVATTDTAAVITERYEEIYEEEVEDWWWSLGYLDIEFVTTSVDRWSHSILTSSQFTDQGHHCSLKSLLTLLIIRLDHETVTAACEPL